MLTIRLALPDDFDRFRAAARALLAARTPPTDVLWSAGEDGGTLLDTLPPVAVAPPVMIPAAFVELARDVVCHRDAERFALLYEGLWRIAQGARALASDAADPLVHRLLRMQKTVRRDLHKMTAFVRFRVVADDAGEHYVAWFEPGHHILRRAAEFFRDRFAQMRWSILTPDGSIHWDGGALAFGAGVTRAQAPAADALEDWWRAYYRATFNPARANPALMRAEMPKKYWRNLPEAATIPDLLLAASGRADAMVAALPSMPRKAKVVPVHAEPIAQPKGSLAELRAEARACERCPLFRDATQTVFGEGPRDAPVVFVGEQPGDQEDLSGTPFVGPAGQMFDRALAEAGIDRTRAYVTNAVKHFKFVPRGKRRIHQKPNVGEIDQCRWWLDRELALLRPQLTVALGATAARALIGRDVTISRERGAVRDLRPGLSGLITVHPSFLLRLPDADAKAREYERFVADLRIIAREFPATRRAA